MTLIQRARLSLHIRALIGVLVVAFVAVLCIAYPVQVFHWIREHQLLEAVLAAIGAAFHVWNTYQAKIVVP
jgi:UDP-N-acetylmuramyl pentapeptide phosphotransferase/UDP-N-acetylglucosamine-1-phosphate transferase